jgi:hypothetical protein
MRQAPSSGGFSMALDCFASLDAGFRFSPVGALWMSAMSP